MQVRELVYEGKMLFQKKRRFLFWTWWKTFAEGGTYGKEQGKLKQIRFKDY